MAPALSLEMALGLAGPPTWPPTWPPEKLLTIVRGPAQVQTELQPQSDLPAIRTLRGKEAGPQPLPGW